MFLLNQNKPAAQATGADPSQCNAIQPIGKIHPCRKISATLKKNSYKFKILWDVEYPKNCYIVCFMTGNTISILLGLAAPSRYFHKGGPNFLMNQS